VCSSIETKDGLAIFCFGVPYLMEESLCSDHNLEAAEKTVIYSRAGWTLGTASRGATKPSCTKLCLLYDGSRRS
jgi:hypothetical protein